ncbi:MAG TPA: hypothetical protein VL593_11440, partial [Ramlibacter sp.]|nr:hypothetical protein [Ramlibacter sp.]
MKLARADVALLKNALLVLGEFRVHKKVSASPSASELSEPSTYTTEPVVTLLLPPDAIAVGAWSGNAALTASAMAALNSPWLLLRGAA